MKKFSMLFLAAAVALVGAIVAPSKAEAIPAFARQVGVPCYACHYQHIPKLNAFGREFKLGGFTKSAQDLIQDDHFSMPPVMNAAFIMKYGFQQASPKGGGADKGVWTLPSDASIYVGGRVAENLGALVEVGVTGAAGLKNSKLIYSKDFGGVRGGVSIYGTDGAGPGYSMEFFNTNSIGTHASIEDAAWSSATLQGGWKNAAQGLSFFAGSPLFFANVGLWGPAQGGAVNPDTGFDLSMYYRLAITPKIGDGLDLMVGIQGSSGKTKVANGGESAGACTTACQGQPDLELKTDSMRFDAQLQTELSGGMSLEVVAAYATAKSDSVFAGTPNDKKTMSLGATLGLMKGAGLDLGYGNIDTGAAANGTYTAMVIGAYYDVAQNVSVKLWYQAYSGDAKPGDNDIHLQAIIGF